MSNWKVKRELKKNLKKRLKLRKEVLRELTVLIKTHPVLSATDFDYVIRHENFKINYEVLLIGRMVFDCTKKCSNEISVMIHGYLYMMAALSLDEKAFGHFTPQVTTHLMKTWKGMFNGYEPDAKRKTEDSE